jgi:hypothetical protein
VRAIIFTGDRNTGDKHDYTGAFRPEALAFARVHGIDRSRIVAVHLDQQPGAMQSQVEAALAMDGPLDLIAWFCHGYRTGLQLGHRIAHADQLARAIAANSVPDGPRVVLYACSTAAAPDGSPSGNGGFADALRDALCHAGRPNCQVDAHTTAAHATKNPNVMRFLGGGSPTGGNGGGLVVDPASPMWATWRAALQVTDLRFRFPLMTVAEIHAELTEAHGPGTEGVV